MMDQEPMDIVALFIINEQHPSIQAELEIYVQVAVTSIDYLIFDVDNMVWS